MKTRSIIRAITACICLGGICLAAGRPNLSGTWVLDKSRSFSNPPGLDQTMTIVHSGDEVKLDAKVVVQGKETVVNETWTLDGREYEFTPPGAAADVKGKRRASWMPGDRGILVEDQSMANTPKGPVPQQVARKYTLSADGNTLTVDYFIDRPGQSFESKRVFVKKQ
ncbi:MAG TPA: hypothetical protein VFD58_29850 [Blastocatellia bacterium]|nr:hypothetical protein [Blastocatellia bacterium]